MYNNTYIIAYDFGTSGVKAVISDGDGYVKCTSTVNYPLITPNPGWDEHDTEDYWHAVCKATRNTLSASGISLSLIAGLAFGTMWKCVIPVDKYGNALYRSIIWLDGRAGKQAAELNRALNTSTYCDKDYIPRLMWLRDNLPDIYANAAYLLEANSYLKYRATGQVGIDISNCFTSSQNAQRNAEYERILDAAGLDKRKFGPSVLPWDEVGKLTTASASELGLLEGTPVFGGCGDIPSIAIGSGCSGFNDAHIYLGSSGWLGFVVPEQRSGIGELYQSLTLDKEILLYVVQAACMAFNWSIDQFYRAESKELGNDIFDLIHKEISQVPAGSMNLLAAPWLHGERPPLSQNARALYLNITGLTDRRHMVRAMLESICYTMRYKLDVYRSETGMNISSVRIVGGGTGSQDWMQAMSDILEIPVEVPFNARHAGAIGTAYCALIGLGLCSDFDEAKRRIEVERRYEPNPDNYDTYRKLFGAFTGLYPALRSTFNLLNG